MCVERERERERVINKQTDINKDLQATESDSNKRITWSLNKRNNDKIL